MATAKKTGIVAKVKKAIAGMFSDDADRKAPKTAAKGSGRKAAKKAPKVVRNAAKKVTVPAKKAAKSASRGLAKKAPTKKLLAGKRSASGTNMDRKLIAVSEPYEVRDWCTSLGCTEAELKAAVAEVGHSAVRVRAHLGARKG
jgi:hypothetical protein